MAKTKILFITHEMAPFLELSNISKITRQLPQAMQEKGFEIRILMPRFGNINERRNRLHEVIRLSGLNIVINENDNPLIIKVASIPTARMQVYFLDNEEFFHRKHVFADAQNRFFEDNDERTIFFCKGALETVKKLGWSPDIVHCHGWMSSLVPLYMRTAYKDDPTFRHSKIIYSIYSPGFSEKLHPAFHKKMMLSGVKEDHVTYYSGGDHTALSNGAIHYADGVVFGSESIDHSIADMAHASGKPLLAFEETSDYDKFHQFYEEVSNEEMVSELVAVPL